MSSLSFFFLNSIIVLLTYSVSLFFLGVTYLLYTLYSKVRFVNSLKCSALVSIQTETVFVYESRHSLAFVHLMGSSTAL